MAANLKSNSESEFSERYNKIYRYQWRTSVFALPQIDWQKRDKLCATDWGYHFIPVWTIQDQIGMKIRHYTLHFRTMTI